MPNLITNASGLDGVTGWTGTAVAADAITRGADGRIALTATGQIETTAAYGVAVTSGDRVLVLVHAWASAGTLTVQARFHDGAGTFSSAVDLTLQRAGQGLARRGLPGSFSYYSATITAPITGKVRLRAVSSNGAATVAILKPFIDPDSDGTHQCWSPGPHINPDLDLPIWPTTLPRIGSQDVSVMPTGTLGGYETDSRIPARRVVGPHGWAVLAGQIKATLEQRDTLDLFMRDLADAPSDAFWFVRPDTDQLVRAHFAADGEPSDNGIGRSRRVAFSLLLEPA